MDFDSTKYRDMLCDVHNNPGVPEDVFDLFKKHPEFKLDTSGFLKHYIHRYICLAYDKESPYVLTISEVPKRKYFAAIEAGFLLNERKEFQNKEIYEVINNKVDNVNRMIVRYLRSQADDDFAYLAVLRDLFYGNLVAMQAGDTSVQKSISQAKKDIDEYTKIITQGDTSRDLKVQVYRFMEEESLMLRPEDIARQIKKEGKADLNGSFSY